MKKVRPIICILLCIFVMPVFSQTSSIRGLTVIAEYTDYPYGVPSASIDLMMNQTGFNLWNNQGSVKDYYYAQTNGKHTITSQIVRVALPQNFNYYHGDGGGGSDLLPHLVAGINQQYPAGFQNLTLRPETGNLWHFNILSRGPRGFGYAFVVENLSIKNNGVLLNIVTGNISNMGPVDQPSLNTVCHEMGHSVFGWTDYYRTNVSNLGDFCAMASAGTETPMPINPGLRYLKGWTNDVIELRGDVTAFYNVESNSYNKILKYTNPTNPKEYLILYPHAYGGYYQSAKAPDQGLAIYYVDEDGGLYSNQGSHPIVHLIQADGLDELHDELSGSHVRGDNNDLFDNVTSVFSSATHPFRWKNGNETGLTISDISAPGANMTFKVNGRSNTINVQTAALVNGTITPSGMIGYPSGQAKVFTIVADIGYEVENVLFNGVSLGAVTTFNFNGSGGAHTLKATFKKRTSGDVLPASWNQIDIGDSRTIGVSGYNNGVFGLESGSYDIWGTNDGLRYVYQSLTGDGELVAHIKDMNKPLEWSKAGLMFRETLSSDSKYFFLAKTPYNSLAPQLRTATGGGADHNPSSIQNLHIYNLYNWVKMTRNGNLFESFCSKDGVNWVLMASTNIAMNQSIYVGFAAGAGSNEVNTKIQIDQVTLKASNALPSVSITTPVNNAKFDAPAYISIAATANDTDGTIAKVELFIGNSITSKAIDIVAPYTFYWTGVLAGTYSITVKATDDKGGVTTSAPVTVVVTNPVTQSPYGGSAWPIPGIIEAENYDLGGQGLAFNDLTTANQGGYYRVDAVDIEPASGGYNVGYITSGEWLEYTVNVTAGTYAIDAKVAAMAAGNSFRLEMDGTAITTITVPATGGWQAWQTVSVSNVVLTAGQKVLRIYANSNDFNIDKLTFTKVITTPLQTPYGGTAWNIPGTVEAENYDLGGQGIAYNDVIAANQGNAFRTDAVDIENCNAGGFNLGYILTDEWVEYTVNITANGKYTINALLAATTAGRTFRLELDGISIASFNVPNTGGWQNWQSTMVNNISLTAGQKVLRIYATSVDFNIDKLIFTRTSAREGLIEEVQLKNAISTAPNPFSEQTTFMVDVANEGHSTLKLYDMNGVLVGVVLDEYLEKGNHKYSFDTHALTSGIYLLHYTSADGVVSKTIIKQ